MSNSRLVYSTDDGDHRRDDGRKQRPAAPSRSGRPRSGPQLPNDGVVRVFREQGGRGGKTVTVVRGLPRSDLQEVASDLKRYCGTGGATKEGAVELQGDHREKTAARLQAKGYTVKLAGG